VRILILGGDGMLGHQLRRSLGGKHDVHVTVRRPLAAYRGLDLPAEGVIDQVDALEWHRLEQAVETTRPDAVVNCIGLIKQRPDASSPVASIRINSLLPHLLCDVCRQVGARLIHFSTDCVFSGRRGGYRETDVPDPVDLYGRTKLVGEVEQAPGLTLRMSIVGLQLAGRTSLVEWFLAQRGTIRGYRRAIYTGLTTLELARLVERVLERHRDLSGIWHVASAPISKYDLLVRLAGRLDRRDVEIVPDDDFVCDRSLRSDAFAAATGYQTPGWDEMLTELAQEIRERGRVRSA